MYKAADVQVLFAKKKNNLQAVNQSEAIIWKVQPCKKTYVLRCKSGYLFSTIPALKMRISFTVINSSWNDWYEWLFGLLNGWRRASVSSYNTRTTTLLCILAVNLLSCGQCSLKFNKNISTNHTGRCMVFPGHGNLRMGGDKLFGLYTMQHIKYLLFRLKE